MPAGAGTVAPASSEAYRKRMARRREVQQQRVGERNLEKGLVLVFTGAGLWLAFCDLDG